jgi:hypothetical protein
MYVLWASLRKLYNTYQNMYMLLFSLFIIYYALLCIIYGLCLTCLPFCSMFIVHRVSSVHTNVFCVQSIV